MEGSFKQMNLFGILPDKEKRKIKPEVWKCMDSCANFTNVFPDGTKDYFIGPGRRARCVKLEYERTISVDNMWHSYCKHYEPKEV